MSDEKQDPLERMLTENGIRSISGDGRSLSIRFGSDKVRHYHLGVFPAEVYRCVEMANGSFEEEHKRTVKLPHRLERATREAGRGWRAGAKRQWVEVRPKGRMFLRRSQVARMVVEALDKLPSPAEFRAVVGKGKNAKLERVRKRWVGIGWVDEGPADGTEPLLVVEG